MARKGVLEHDLVSIINSELAKLEECPGCRINEIRPLNRPDAEGCNWKRPDIRCNAFVSGSLCSRTADRVMEWARSNFELRPI